MTSEELRNFIQDNVHTTTWRFSSCIEVYRKSFESCPLSWVRAPPGDNISIFNIFLKN